MTTSAFAQSKPTMVLVHGAWEEANIWEDVAARLKSDGYRVVVVKLPGRPSAPLSPGKVTLDLYRDTVLANITKEKRPVTLVGHSFGGFPISAVAEKAPAKVRTLIYVAAYLPQDGQSLLDLGNSDKDSKIGPHLQIQQDKGIISIEYSARADLFCNNCNEGLRAAIPSFIVDEPLAPLASPIHLTQGKFGKTDRVYIHTAKGSGCEPVAPSANDISHFSTRRNDHGYGAHSVSDRSRRLGQSP
jgi:pimeloyl-ACP methyl ester carboxylesterase